MGKVYEYESKYVFQDRITYRGSIERNIRYLLTIPLKNKGDTSALVITRNPGKAGDKHSDKTANNIVKFCFDQGYSEVNIMSLFAYYSDDPKEIVKLIEENKLRTAIGEENDKIMREVCKKVDDVIVAWGGNSTNITPQYNNRIRSVIDITNHKNSFYVESISSNGMYPRHPLVWSAKKDISKYPWNPPK